jgi:hypothetical protein
MEDGGNLKQEDTLDFVEGKDWSPSYLNLECLFSFSDFVTGLVRPGLVVKPRL